MEFDRLGEEHKGLSGYLKERQPVQISLLTLNRLETARANSDVIYVVENPAIFSAIVQKFPKEISVICTSGQLKLAALVLLDLLKNQGYTFIYGGDFDPEGLQIADKLKKKYGEHLKFWLYEKEYYEKSLSTVSFNENRGKKLDHVDSEELQEIVTCIRNTKKAGYQENILEEYLHDIEQKISQTGESRYEKSNRRKNVQKIV